MSPRRPPPLVMMAVGLFAAVVVIGAVVLATRSGPRRGGDDGDRSTEAHEPEPSAAPVAEPAAPAPAPAAPPPAAASAPAEPSLATGAAAVPEGTIPPGASGDDLPIWARPPRVTVTPFPEGARINEPMPPVVLQPWMTDPNGIVPGGSVDPKSPGGGPGTGDGG